MRRISLRRTGMAAVALLVGAIVTSCGDDDGSNTGRLTGTATFPQTNAPAAGSSVTVFPLESAGNPTPIAQSATDADGSYDVTFPRAARAFAVVSGPNGERASGLFNPGGGSVGKNFDGITDIACFAGVSAVADGTLSADEVTNQRIQNLEAGAAAIVDQVDFNNNDSFDAAVALVRANTNEGANPPQ